MTESQTPPPAAPPPTVGYQGPEPDKDARTMAMLCHLLAIFTGFIGPLIIWLIKKDSSPFVNDQGKEALNFQITLFLGYIIGIVTACLIIGYFIILGVWVCAIVFSIIGSMAANRGEAYRYPFNLRLIK